MRAGVKNSIKLALEKEVVPQPAGTEGSGATAPPTPKRLPALRSQVAGQEGDFWSLPEEQESTQEPCCIKAPVVE